MANKDEVGGGNSNGIKSIITSKKSTKADYLNFEGTVGARDFRYLIPDVKKVFNHLRHAFTKAPILQHFDPERYIRVKTNTSGHTIIWVLNQLTLDDLGQWHSMVYYL